VTSPDAVVIGAGSVGAWTAWHLRKAGLSVAFVDAYGPGNTRASSGGESRVIRAGYGPDEIYTRWALRSIACWRELSTRVELPVFHGTGVLWLGRVEDRYMEATLDTLRRCGAPHERLERRQIAERFPQIEPGSIEWGILEPQSGALSARRGVAVVAAEAAGLGVERIDAAAAPPKGRGRLETVALSTGDRLAAGVFVFACGPWMGRIFPELLGDRIFPTRQEVFYFGAAGGDPRFRPPAMPAWLDLTEEWYGIPDLEARGFKLALDVHGPRFDPDTGDRTPTAEGIEAAKQFLSRRFPTLAKAPLLAAEVCQYENTSNGDFLIDRHPDLENVWLVGGGSGHGFKHGPAVGEYVSERIREGGPVEPRFCLDTKATVQRRMIH
jgi:monomeric sarcosine oxidase